MIYEESKKWVDTPLSLSTYGYIAPRGTLQHRPNFLSRLWDWYGDGSSSLISPYK